MFTKWLSISWWQYLLRKPSKYDKYNYCSLWKRIICRAGGHKAGVWYYNANGSEPDMHCIQCGDDLG